MAVALPECLRRLFWDTDFAAVSWAGHRDAIIRRVLEEGGTEAIGWLRREVGDAALRDWIVARRGRGLGRRRLRYWELLLDLPPGAVDTWLRDPSRRVWDGR